MEKLIQDLRFAFRMLRRSPGVTAIAVLSLGLGIGANTAIASLVDAVFLRPLPVEEPDRLTWIYRTFEASATGSGFFGAGLLPTSYLNYLDFEDRASSFDGLLAASGGPLNVSGSGEPEQVAAGYVTANYFEVLGVRTALGRGFLPEDNPRGGARPVAVLSDALWRNRYGADPEIVGREIPLNGRAFTVIGVAPPEFHGLLTLFEEDLWVPSEIHPELNQAPGGIAPLEHRGFRMFWMVGRLREGVSREAAEQELAGIAAQLAVEHPDLNRDRGVRAVTLSEGALNLNQRGMFVRAGAIAIAAVGLVLLVACVNVGSLLLARARGRRAETAMRLSLGAPRRRLLRQWLTESVLLSLLGGAVGWLLAVWTQPLLLQLRPPFLGEVDVPLDLRILGFTAGVSVLVGLLFGVAPALQASRTDLLGPLRERGPSGGRRRFGLRRVLVAGQVALSVVSLCIAGLFLRSLERARAIDPGYQADRLGVVGFDAGALGIGEEEGRVLFDRLLEEVEALPEVGAAGLASSGPLGFAPERRVFPEGAEELVGSEGVYTPVKSVSPGFFAALGLEAVEGRLFDAADRTGTRPVVVVNETAARTWWPRGALGRAVRWPVDDRPPWEVVGVVPDVKYTTLGEEPRPYLYRPLAQDFAQTVVLHLRSEIDPAAALAAARGRIRPLAPDLPLLDPQPVGEVIEQSLWAPAFGARLLSTFGVLALLLAGVGIYGVVSQSVAERRREVGIRIALGAGRSRVLSGVLRDGMTPVAIGVALGLAGALVAVRQMRALLYQGPEADLVVFGAAAATLGLIALLACALPATRAVRVDPVRTLRAE